MATEVVMPQMGESIAEGTITRWLVKVGEKIERDQPLFEISTDKVDAEIPSPATGVLIQVDSQGGETVPVNQVVAYVGEPGEQVGGGSATAASPGAGSASEPASPASTAAPEASEAAAVADAAASESTSLSPLEDRLRRFSSPLVRNIAAKEGVDLAQLTGTGIHGRVTKTDILAYLETRSSTPAAAPSAVPPAGQGRPVGGFQVAAYGADENVTIEPMSKIRQITAAHMAYSKATSAHVTSVFHVDMTRVASVRNRVKKRFLEANGTKLTYMPFIFKAVCGALRAFPQLNAAIDGTNIVYKKDINLGMAVALDHGLIVPVLRNADQLSLSGLAQQANDLADRARTKRMKPDEIQKGTFTITNPGVFGSLFGTPVINQPQVAILGIGAVEKRPIVVTDPDGADALAIRTMCYFALTFDHRLIDGSDADHFMVHIKKALETDPWKELETYL
ncbi:MAG: 2-oxoglutarate dehydrogenase, E2 component, dihydrolipoamide succinyltransferase [Deltaproteobacteria bacterium]|nr:2-oxoglutarate dehydrogenase, E2 component, dihydrolipoamide succinyltransferase [Deltaproteobacteria bacterium]